MNIEKLFLYNFRIYSGKKEFDFKKKKLVIFLGPNGAGKSAIYDAIEWAITGDISRYADSKENSFNFIINNKSYNTGKYETYVEITFDNGMTIKRSVEKKEGIKTREVKKVIIDGNTFSWGKGTSEIYNKITGDDTLEGLDRFTKTFKPSTILSQDEISNFVLSDNPEDRLKLFMDILSLEGFGVDFKKDISSNKKIFRAKYEEIKNEISDLQINKEELSGELKQKETELKYEKSIEDGINIYTKDELRNNINSFLVDNKKIIGRLINIDILNDDTIIILNNLIDELRAYKDDLEKDSLIINSYLNSGKSSISNMVTEENILNNTSLDDTKNKENMDLLIQEVLKKKSTVKETIDEIEIYKSELEEIKKTDEIKISLGNEMKNLYTQLNNQGFNSIKDFEEQKSKILLEEKALQNILGCKKISDVITQDKLGYSQKENLFNENKKKTSKILMKLESIEEELNSLYKETNNYQQSEIDKIIYTIQEELITNNRNICIVCGSNLGDSKKMASAIEVLRKANELEQKAYSRRVLDIENLKKHYKFLLKDMNKNNSILASELNELANKILINEEKYNSTVINLNEADLDREKENIEKEIEVICFKKINYLKLEVIVSRIKEIEKKLSDFGEIQDFDKAKLSKLSERIKKNYYNIIDKFNFDRQVENNNKLENKSNILEFKTILSIMDKELDNELNQHKSKKYILQAQMKITQQKLQELRNNMVVMENRNNKCIELLNKHKVEDFKEFIIKSDEIKLNMDVIVNQLKEKIGLINANISNINISVIGKKLNEINKKFIEVNNKLINLEVAKKEIEDKANMLDDLYNNLPNIMSDLLSEFLKISNKEINKKFVQISPYISNKYINIVSREGGLYILLTDSEEYDELIKMSRKDFEKQVNASMILSSAQSNILALSVFITSNKINVINNFDIIGLDDPFQNMDDINIYSLIDILCDLIKCKQVLVSTHDHSFVNLLVAKSNLRLDEIEIVEYITYDENGVYILGDDLEM